MRKGLILARVGDNSLHPQWLKGSSDRNWDLALSSFGKGPVAARDACVLVEHETGPKWGPLHSFITKHWGTISRYRFVMLPDDDLAFSSEQANEFFDICDSYDFAIAQPGLDYKSYFSHKITLKRHGLLYRTTNYVETMCPCFRIDALERVLPSFLETKSGWGIDLTWFGKLNGMTDRMAVVDKISITHTRPVGGALYQNNRFDESPIDELERMLLASGRSIEDLETFYGVTKVAGMKLNPNMLKPLDGLALLLQKAGVVVRRHYLWF